MRSSASVAALVALAVPTLVGAHNLQGAHQHVARQAATPTTTPPPAATIPPTASFSLLSENPTAVPLSIITANETAQPTTSLFTTFTAGATPTYMSGAPGLPNLATVIPTNYPTLDVIPPTDSPEVLQWIQEVANSGVSIPNITATVDGGCPANPAAVADTSRCWWTCGGCVRKTDITTCPDKYTWGLTYDDGPAPYTPNLLEYLNQVNLKATFFVVGSRAISYPTILQTEYMLGHQIGVHTWSHHDLTMMTNEQIIAELGWSKKIIKDVIGVTPNMMRPPFGDIDDRVRAISIAMGLTPTIWTRISPEATFDTNDFNINAGLVSVQQVLQNWEYILANASTIDNGFIVLEHDLFEQTVDVATGYILPDALAHKNPSFDIKPIASCLNLPMEDAYIELNNNSTNPPESGLSATAVTLSTGAPGAVSTSGGSGSSGSSGSGSSSSSGSSASGSPSGAVTLSNPIALFTALVGVVVSIVAGASALLL